MAIFMSRRRGLYSYVKPSPEEPGAVSKAGFPSLMLFLPDEWDCTLKGLAKLSRDGVDSVRSAVVELENEGYILRRQNRNAHGRLATNEYTVYEVPR